MSGMLFVAAEAWRARHGPRHHDPSVEPANSACGSPFRPSSAALDRPYARLGLGHACTYSRRPANVPLSTTGHGPLSTADHNPLSSTAWPSSLRFRLRAPTVSALPASLLRHLQIVLGRSSSRNRDPLSPEPTCLPPPHHLESVWVHPGQRPWQSSRDAPTRRFFISAVDVQSAPM